MKNIPPKNEAYLESMTALQFLESYNENMPSEYPKVTLEILDEFKAAHTNLFKNKNVWTLDMHRKRMIEWLRARQR